MSNEAGKGDTYRPVDNDRFSAGYEDVFGIESLCMECNRRIRFTGAAWIHLSSCSHPHSPVPLPEDDRQARASQSHSP